MTLTDTGPLVALVNQTDPAHAKCVDAVKHLPKAPLITTWPCFTEAMYLLFREVGYSGQAALAKLYQNKRMVFHDLDEKGIGRILELMDKYRGTPMDLADASLVATAESLGLKLIFTLDGDFRIYRLADGSALDVVP